jgi:hypothetical protein
MNMKYSAIHQKFIIDEGELKRASHMLLHTMKRSRILAGVPLGKRKSEGALTNLDYVEMGIIEIAKAIGIDLGAEWGHDIDLTDVEK